MRFRPLLAVCSLLACTAPSGHTRRDSAPHLQNDSGYVQVQATTLGAPERWDYLQFDDAARRVYLAHGDRTDVVDADSGRIVGHVGPLDGAHGTAIVTDLHRGFADSGLSASLTVFDLDSLKTITRLPAGKDADAVAYDDFSRRVFVMNGDTGTISVFDAASLQPVATVTIGSKLEFAASDGRGALFVNLAAEGAVARIDSRTATVTARWPVAGCVSPHGMAYDAATARIFTSCLNGQLKVLDAADGKVVATLPIGTGSDSVAIDAKRRLVFSANGSGTISIIALRGADRFDLLPPLRTPAGARTMAVDPATGRIFLASATADGRIPSTAPGGGARYRFAPGSLRLLMLDPR